MAKRKKALAVDVPATIDTARMVATTYAAHLAEIDAINAERQIRIAEVNKDCDARIQSRAHVIEAGFAMLKGWWEAGGATAVAGKARSGKFDGLHIGFRLTPHALKLPSWMKQHDVVARLRMIGDGDRLFNLFTRVRIDLDKEAVIKALKGDAETEGRDWFLNLGCQLHQRDEFFIEPLPRGEADSCPAFPAPTGART